MKRNIGFLVAVAVFLCVSTSLFAGGRQQGDGGLRLAFLPGDMANESQAFSARIFQQLGPEFGFQVTIFDGRADALVQAQTVNTAIAQGYDVIWVNPNDIHGIIPSLNAARNAGVVVGMFSSDLPPASAHVRHIFVGVNDNEAGETAARSFINRFPGGANIVEIGGQAGHDAAIRRHDGFNSVIRGSNINVLAYNFCAAWSTADAMAIMEDMIVRFGNTIEGVFVHWCNGATGVIQAARAAGMNDLHIVGVDGNRAGFNQVRDGSQASSIAQDFHAQVRVALDMSRRSLTGQSYQTVNMVPLVDINLANINQYPDPEW